MEKLKQLGSALKEWVTITAQKLVETLKQGIRRTLLEANVQLLTGLIKFFGQVQEAVKNVLLEVKNKLLVLAARAEKKLKDNGDK